MVVESKRCEEGALENRQDGSICTMESTFAAEGTNLCRQLDQWCNCPPNHFLLDLEWERVTKMIRKEFDGVAFILQSLSYASCLRDHDVVHKVRDSKWIGGVNIPIEASEEHSIGKHHHVALGLGDNSFGWSWSGHMRFDSATTNLYCIRYIDIGFKGVWMGQISRHLESAGISTFTDNLIPAHKSYEYRDDSMVTAISIGSDILLYVGLSSWAVLSWMSRHFSCWKNEKSKSVWVFANFTGVCFNRFSTGTGFWDCYTVFDCDDDTFMVLLQVSSCDESSNGVGVA
uniref:Uncharacterized protein n=1 Tax=Tanacetum cinerariifolium TaxID=118510 RepID=A0A6L2J690_TANCI|nr:hypothetical protein [Tanacetum cinerariifolium]